MLSTADQHLGMYCFCQMGFDVILQFITTVTVVSKFNEKRKESEPACLIFSGGKSAPFFDLK